ncbi:LysR family transcriptional regulator [Lacrimispora sp. 210928-DFI.3.58]|nr:LysR family transcriptional regulator [Lacrimispora sp. 210928-DFI.3.58]
MDMNHLREFTVLAETKSYWEAAYRLFLNQSILSKHIKAMEAELDAPLFIRTTRKVELTEFGEALLPYARDITKLHFEYSAKLMQMQNYRKGLISMGSLPAMAQYHITDLVLEFERSCPEYKIKITEDDPKQLTRLLLDRGCELAFLREMKKTEALDRELEGPLERLPYVTDHMIAVLPLSHPLAGREELTLRDLKNEAFALLKENTMMHDLCCQACQEAGFIPNIIFTSHRLDSILDMVTKGGCAALLMDRHVEYPLESAFALNPPFAAVRIVPSIETSISLCWKRGEPLSPSGARFVEFFRNRDASCPKSPGQRSG